MTTEKPPLHRMDCDGRGQCAGCEWFRERLAEINAWNKFYALFSWVHWSASTGRGQG